MADARLGLVIPFHDEAAGCVRDLGELVLTLSRGSVPWELVLVDNGSRDGTAGLLAGFSSLVDRVRVVSLRDNAGYGGGILAGLQVLETPWVGWHWGDGQVSPETVVAAWRMAEAGRFSLVKARRVRRDDGLERAFVSRTYNAMARRLLGTDSSDLNGCPKVMRRELLDRVAPRSTDWLLDLEVMLAAQALDLPVGEVPAVMKPRRGGRSHVRAGTLLEFARAMVELRRGESPWGG